MRLDEMGGVGLVTQSERDCFSFKVARMRVVALGESRLRGLQEGLVEN